MFPWLRKLIDPRGPLGEIVSPAAVWKERAGLPIDAPHTIRAQAPQTTFDVERALQPPRLLPADTDIPKDRVRAVNAFIEEHYAPVYAPINSTDLATIFATKPQVIGWRVTQRVKKEARARAPMTAEQFAEHIQSLQIQASDEYYNGFYPTIRGTDSVMTEAGLAKGGTHITRGRAEYEAKTRGMVHWDKGFVAEREKALAAEASKGVQGVRAEAERLMGERLPMSRPVGPAAREHRD